MENNEKWSIILDIYISDSFKSLQKYQIWELANLCRYFTSKAAANKDSTEKRQCR
jgi:hypothetical protein